MSTRIQARLATLLALATCCTLGAPPAQGIAVSRERAAAEFAAAELDAASRAQDSNAARPWKLEPSSRAALDAIAHALARTHRDEERTELFAWLERLGCARDELAALRAACDAEAAKAAQDRASEAASAAALAEAAKRARAVAKSLEAELAALAPDARAELAALVLRLDDTSTAAHVALGHSKFGAAWRTADERACDERRARIAAALRDACKLEIEIDVAESRHPLLRASPEATGIELTWQNLSFHTTLAREKALRILRQALRANALSSYLRSGDLAPQRAPFSQTWVWAGSQASYSRMVEEALATGEIGATAAGSARAQAIFRLADGTFVSRGIWESEESAALLVYSTPLRDGAQASLRAGHLNWVSLAVLGTPLPGFTWTSTRAGGLAGDVHREDRDEQREREEFEQLASAGLVGCRSYLAYLARNDRAPAWRATFADQFGKLRGPALLKATSMAEFVQELDLLEPLLRATDGDGIAEVEAAYAQAVDSSLGAFDARWRAWLLGQPSGLAQRLDAPSAAKPADARRGDSREDLLDALNALRSHALKTSVPELRAVTSEPSLDEGARAHAAYLVRNSPQARAWPDAHEEYSDRAGFTTQGAWAALHALIAPDAANARAALDAWMGTFYRRLPLLDPGLLRVGWGFEKSIAVLDAKSLCQPAQGDWSVVWPYDGMSSVPTRATPEIPEPVPGVDPKSLGYPITLQVGKLDKADAGLEIELELFDGDTRIECHAITPSQPLNTQLAHPNVWGLIPKQPLKPKRVYRVHARWVGGARGLDWTFNT